MSPYVCTVANLTFPPSSSSVHISFTTFTPFFLHCVTVGNQVSSHLLIDFRVWLISRFENKDGVSGPDNMARSASVSSLKPLVSKRLETKPGTVEGSGLLRIAHPPL